MYPCNHWKLLIVADWAVLYKDWSCSISDLFVKMTEAFYCHFPLYSLSKSNFWGKNNLLPKFTALIGFFHQYFTLSSRELYIYCLPDMLVLVSISELTLNQLLLPQLNFIHRFVKWKGAKANLCCSANRMKHIFQLCIAHISDKGTTK